jgi:heptosyltransferase III
LKKMLSRGTASALEAYSPGLLDHLIRTYPGCRITIACGRVAEGVFARMPNRKRTILMDKRAYHLHWLPLWRDAVGTLWDLVVDLRGSALAFLVPTRRRAVMRRLPGCKFEQFAALLSLNPPPLPVVWTAPVDHARAASLLPVESPL